MFDMTITGLKISELRKEKNMTQMELADKMGISFQAVSNWECGNSMPDVAKLPELAQIFDVTIDELLNEQSKLINSAAKEELGEYLNSHEVSAEELRHTAPILKPKQIKEVIANMKIQSLAEIEDVLPFLEKDTINELALKAMEKEDYTGLEDIAPFVGQDILDKIATEMTANGKNIADAELAPFVSKSILIECAEDMYKKRGLSGLEDIMPFLPKEVLIKIAKEEYDAHGLRHFEAIAPFLDNAYLNGLAREAIQKEGFAAICPIAPFLDKKMLSDFIREMY